MKIDRKRNISGTLGHKPQFVNIWRSLLNAGGVTETVEQRLEAHPARHNLGAKYPSVFREKHWLLKQLRPFLLRPSLLSLCLPNKQPAVRKSSRAESDREQVEEAQGVESDQ